MGYSSLAGARTRWLRRAYEPRAAEPQTGDSSGTGFGLIVGLVYLVQGGLGWWARILPVRSTCGGTRFEGTRISQRPDDTKLRRDCTSRTWGLLVTR